MPTFPKCAYAGRMVADSVRVCESPQIVGVGNVTADICAACSYRTQGTVRRASGPRSLLADCLHLGAHVRGGQTEKDARFACRHPAHGIVARDDCRQCPDYEFPLLTPRMALNDVKRHRQRMDCEQPEGWWNWPNVQQAERELAGEFLSQVPAYPGHGEQFGIVVIGGGKYLPSAYVTARVIRHHGCQAPTQLWHLAGEVDDTACRLLAALHVECVNADELRAARPFRFLDGHWWKGWQLKAYALLHAPFRHVLMLDADCYPLRDPQSLLAVRAYRRRGALIWPDIETSRWLLNAEQLRVFGVRDDGGSAAESGQLLVDRQRCWRELSLAAHYNARADFTYRIIWGDKDTYPIAWNRLGRKYGRLWPTSQPLREGILQMDERGKPLFLHRCTGKFALPGTEFDSTPGQHGSGWNFDLPLEHECRAAWNHLQEAMAARNDACDTLGARRKLG